MKRLVVISLCALVLTGCGLEPDAKKDTDFDKVTVDGTECVVARSYRAVSIDCDWSE